jgi:peptidyl-tRNA hydrolase
MIKIQIIIIIKINYYNLSGQFVVKVQLQYSIKLL